MEYDIKLVFQVMALIIEIFGGLVIIVAAAYTAFSYLRSFRRSVTEPISTDVIRIKLGKGLSFGLEFLIAADVLKTLIRPTLTEVSILGAIIAIRIALNFFLEREIVQLSKSQEKAKATEEA